MACLTGGSVYLVGNIEMGIAPKWQMDITKHFSSLPIIVLNPRQNHWNTNLKQDISNPEFHKQVQWKLKYQEKAIVIAIYLQPGTISLISLMELGLFIKTKKMVICCPDGFHRKGNVQVMCNKYNGKLVEMLNELVEKVKDRMKCCKESSNKNTIRNYISWFNRLILEAK